MENCWLNNDIQHVITIDPSNSHCGFALWDVRQWEGQKIARAVFIEPVLDGVIGNTAEEILSVLNLMIGKFNIIQCYIEDAAFMDGSVKGQVSARSGAVVKLAEFIGMVAYLFSHLHIDTELISVQRWKGTMSKKAVIHRIKKYCPGVEGYKDSWDAIGIGLYLTGVINQ